jgi:formimidoylglutamate deiminase
VEYLFDQFSVDPRWTLIHATHLETQEIQMIATSGAVVCLCPTTEANLGDGIFRAKEFLAAAGKIAIGSDSHISIDPREELRMLEYSQRLSRRERAILGTETESVGHRLYTQCAAGGAAAIGVRAGVIDVGYRADFTLIDTDHAAIGDVSPDRWLDRLVFCNHGNPVLGACVGGVLRMASPTN